ncbi:hypothetical protein [Chlamydiifrater volucris]|uniref:hypothetical protein n=1 Tax=Chlamydiifrater volucris TaxID=2681470 RepID=UPI001BD15E93|nr:hypothetical protein [Chlamydiifrater volucris]
MYVKSDFWETLSNEEKKKLTSPITLMEEIVSESPYWLSDFDVEVTKGKVAPNFRCERELIFILLGFLSLEELVALGSYCKEECKKGSVGDVFYNSLYAQCIKRSPKIVAAEAAYLSWLKSSFSYLRHAGSSIVMTNGWYRSTLLIRISSCFSTFGGDGEKTSRVATALSRLSGWAPACLASMKLEVEALSRLKSYLEGKKEYNNWEYFCRKVSDFCNKSVHYKNALGKMSCFVEFLEKGDQSSFLQERPFLFDFEKSDKDFFAFPRSLWDMSSLCEKDPELAIKIEEGLSHLSQCGYLGSQSVEELQEVESIVLGLKSP